MRFTIDGKSYELVQNGVTFAEAKAIEKVTGETFHDIETKIDVARRPGVAQAMYWIAMKRVDSSIAYSDLDDVNIRDIEFDDVEDEASDPPESPEPSTSPPGDEPTSEAQTLPLSD